MSDNQEHSLTPAEFARQRGISLDYVYRCLWDGRIEGTKTVDGWRIPSSQLERRREAARA